MAQFSAIPEIPLGGMSEWMFTVLSAMKENIEMLSGTRGAGAESVGAVTHGSVTTNPPPPQSMTQISATGAGFTVGGASVASAADHAALCNDVQKLSNDVAQIHASLTALIENLKG